MTAPLTITRGQQPVRYSWLLDLLQQVGPCRVDNLIAEAQQRRWRNRDPESIRRYLHRLRERGRADRRLIPIEVDYSHRSRRDSEWARPDDSDARDQAVRVITEWYAVDDLPYWLHPALTPPVVDYLTELDIAGNLTDQEAADRLLLDPEHVEPLRAAAGILIQPLDPDSLWPAWTLTPAGRKATRRLA